MGSGTESDSCRIVLSLGIVEGAAVAEVGKMRRNVKESNCRGIIREEESMAVGFGGFMVVRYSKCLHTHTHIYIYTKMNVGNVGTSSSAKKALEEPKEIEDYK